MRGAAASVPRAPLSVAGLAVLALLAALGGERAVRPAPLPALAGPTKLGEHARLEPPDSRVAHRSPGEAPRSETTAEKTGEAPSVDRIRSIVGALARELEAERYVPAPWEARLSASASEIGHGALGALFALDVAPDLSLTEHVVVAELLRVLRTDAGRDIGRLSGSTLAALRREVDAPPDLRTLPLSVGARALAAWGDAIDHARLLELARAGEGRAYVALGAAATPEVARVLAGEPDPLALIVLEGFVRESGWVLDGRERENIAATLAARLLDPAADGSLRHRALSALCTWDPEEAAASLSLALADPDLPASVAEEAARRLARLPGGPAALGGTLQDETSPTALAVAEALEPEALERDAALRDSALDVLLRASQYDQDASRRRRAIHALGRLEDASALLAISDALAADPDPAVRCAAVVALGGYSPSAAEPSLARAAREDASASIRRLALQELGREPVRE